MSSEDNLLGSAMIPVAQDNTIVLEVDNLLADWPTYVIKLTPDHPGPLKIILRLKDVTKQALPADGFEEMCEAAKARAKGTSITLDLASSDEVINHDKTVLANAVPVAFHGIPKDTPPPKPKFLDNDHPWPPVRRPRSLRPIDAKESVSLFTVLRTVPVSVKAIAWEEHYG
ncbi:hypothetical protein JVT61DRAFT_11803 [Boletus reticuloceps]|uniref:Uncharacterized protein n=1 Tax=Boletus reticuloceps TaxID=495285 RepID=A0A8I3ABK7_9AGAM|nr:hypothetical protein JVT61DRAFT_11803 [Boletus reticuloceps]